MISEANRSNVSIIFLSILAIFLLTPLSGFSQNTIENLEPEEYFDFWVGTWEVSWEEGEGTGRGTNHVEKTLDGTVI